MHACVLSLQLCLTLCDPVNCNPPDFSVHVILQARILEWVAMPSPRDLPNPGIEPASLESPALAGGFFTTSTTLEAPEWRIRKVKGILEQDADAKEGKIKALLIFLLWK